MNHARPDCTQAKALRGNMDNFLAFYDRGADAAIPMTKIAGTF